MFNSNGLQTVQCYLSSMNQLSLPPESSFWWKKQLPKLIAVLPGEKQNLTESYWFGSAVVPPPSPLHAAFLSFHFSWLHLLQPFKHILISSDHSMLFHHENTKNWTDRMACKVLFNWVMTFPIFCDAPNARMLLLLFSLIKCKHLKGQTPGTFRGAKKSRNTFCSFVGFFFSSRGIKFWQTPLKWWTKILQMEL